MPDNFFNNAINAATGSNKRNVNVRLTEAGKQRLQDLEPQGTDYTILSAISRHAPCDVSTVVKDPQIKFNYEQVRDVMMRFLNNGWITEAV